MELAMGKDKDITTLKRRNFLTKALAFGMGAVTPLLFTQTSTAASMGNCRYCGSTAYGPGCPHSPYKVHEHIEDEKKCEFCGSTAYGPGCPHSPTKKHRHGHGANKCIWCGSTANGSGCPYSPTGRHEK
jgi:hypothetical protein